MKKLLICSMMCLMTLVAKAQVLTSATVQKVYESVTTDVDNGFAYNAECDGDGRIIAMEVYRKKLQRKVGVTLIPVCRYLYTYTADGLLSSRIKYVWRRNTWRCFARHDYSLTDYLYSVDYSRWNRKKNTFDEATGKMTYTLLPDRTVSNIACYCRHHKNAPLKLEWQTEVISQPVGWDYFLTKK